MFDQYSSVEVINGDYFIPSHLVRYVITSMQKFAADDTAEALESLLKFLTQHEIYLRKN